MNSTQRNLKKQKPTCPLIRGIQVSLRNGTKSGGCILERLLNTYKTHSRSCTHSKSCTSKRLSLHRISPNTLQILREPHHEYACVFTRLNICHYDSMTPLWNLSTGRVFESNRSDVLMQLKEAARFSMAISPPLLSSPPSLL